MSWKTCKFDGWHCIFDLSITLLIYYCQYIFACEPVKANFCLTFLSCNEINRSLRHVSQPFTELTSFDRVFVCYPFCFSSSYLCVIIEFNIFMPCESLWCSQILVLALPFVAFLTSLFFSYSSGVPWKIQVQPKRPDEIIFISMKTLVTALEDAFP